MANKPNKNQEDKGSDTLSKKNCFFITPIGENDSSDFRKMEDLLCNVLNPVLEKYRYTTIVAHEIQRTGSIGDQVFNSIKDADLIITNLTGLNPNVMYETAVAHSFGKPTIMIVEKDGKTKLPFDLISDRAIFYEDTIGGCGFLCEELDKKICHLQDNAEIDNPVLRVMKQAATLSSIKGDDVQTQMYQMLLDLSSDVSELKRDHNRKYKNEFFVKETIEKEWIIEVIFDTKPNMDMVEKLRGNLLMLGDFNIVTLNPKRIRLVARGNNGSIIADEVRTMVMHTFKTDEKSSNFSVRYYEK